MKPQFRAHEAYVESVRLLIELHGLMKRGHGDSLDADRVRDQIDNYWNRLDEHEIARIEGLSADLYTLEPDSPIVHPEFVSRSDQAFWDLLSRLKTKDEFDGVLHLLRTRPECIEAAQAAFLRGRAYEELGEREVAAMFLEEAIRRDPGNESYASQLLIRLGNMGFAEKAAYWTRELQRTIDNPSPALLLLFAKQFRDEWQSADAGRRPNLIQQSIVLLDRAVQHLDGKPDPILRALLVNALLQQAAYLNLAGMTSEAIASANRAVELAPDNDDLSFVVRGMLVFRSNRSGAIADFSKAVERGTKNVWPYYGLAHVAITEGEFARCRELASNAIQLTNDADALASLWEMLAISIAELEQDKQKALLAFRKAIALAPDNLRIRNNFEQFLADSQHESSRNITWQRNEQFPSEELRKLAA